MEKLEIASLFGFEKAMKFATNYNRWLASNFETNTVEKNLVQIDKKQKTVTVDLCSVFFINYCNSLEYYFRSTKPEYHEIASEIAKYEFRYWLKHGDLQNEF